MTAPASDIDWTIKITVAAILDNLWSSMKVNSGSVPTTHMRWIRDLRWAEKVLTWDRGRRLRSEDGHPQVSFEWEDENEKRCPKCGEIQADETAPKGD